MTTLFTGRNANVRRRPPANDTLMPAFTHLDSRPKADDRMRMYGLLLLADLVAIQLGFGTAALIRFSDATVDQLGHVLLAFVPMFLVIAFHRAAYTLDALKSWTHGLRRALGALGLAALALIATGFAWRVSAGYSRIFVVLGVVASAALIVALRYALDRLKRRWMPDGPVDEVMLCDGVDTAAAGCGKALDARALNLRPHLDCPISLDRLGRALCQADRILVACAPEDRVKWTHALMGIGTDVEMLLPEAEMLGVLDLGRHNGRPTAIVARGQLAPHQRAAKRLFDLAATLWLLPMLLLVTLIVALLIKLDDGGPVFFEQHRIGQGNRLFTMYKFRSMRVEASDAQGDNSAARGDARQTQIGAWLRRTSIDELPQLFNVLKGDMSLVGPRPHATGSTADQKLFWHIDQRYWFRHAAKPGLTGLAQVRGYRGATETSLDLVNRIQADLEYLSDWSLWRDIRILCATSNVVCHDNAY